SNSDFSISENASNYILTYNGIIPGNSEVRASYSATFTAVATLGLLTQSLQLQADPQGENISNQSSALGINYNRNLTPGYLEEYTGDVFGYMPTYTNPTLPADCKPCSPDELIIRRVYYA